MPLSPRLTIQVLRNNIYFDVDIGDVPTPGRPGVLMAGHCDEAIRASTHARSLASCPDPAASPADKECCCHVGCDQGKCSSFHFERNIVYSPAKTAGGGNGSLIGTTWSRGLDNFTFGANVYFVAGAPSLASMFNATGGNSGALGGEDLAQWQAAGKDAQSLGADPLFVGGGAPAFALDPKSPALAAPIGFVPIDLSTVGPRSA